MKPSFAGNGLLERMRSTTFAILGITTAMCLGLVAIVAQQGLPVLPGLPLPGVAAEQGGRVHDAAVAQPDSAPGLTTGAEVPAADGGSGAGGAQPERSTGSPGASGVAGSRQLATDQAPAPPNPGNETAPTEVPPAAPAPTTPSASTDASVAAAPEATSAVSAGAGTSPGKATAAVDPSSEDEEQTREARAQARPTQEQGKRDARGGRGGGRPVQEAPPAAVPPPVQEEVDAEEAADAAAATQAQTDEDRVRSFGRGNSSRRFGR